MYSSVGEATGWVVQGTQTKEEHMNRVKRLHIVLSLALTTSLLLSTVAGADSTAKPAGPDKLRPVPATDVELGAKVSVRKPGPPIVPPSRGSKNKAGAATGTLGAAVSGDRYAVVVGISDYPGSEMDLTYADDDALDMDAALRTVYGYTHVALLTDLDATRGAILTAVENIPADAAEVVFFYSGHGATGQAEDGDSERKDEAIAVVADGGTSWVPIWDGKLTEAFTAFARVVFVFDSCFAGGMNGDLNAPGRVLAVASPETGLSLEGPEWNHGEFSYWLVHEGMLQGKANTHDYDSDTALYEPEQVTVEEAFDHAKANCDLDKPTIGDSFEDDLLL
jgi:hypothetical protein